MIFCLGSLAAVLYHKLSCDVFVNGLALCVTYTSYYNIDLFRPVRLGLLIHLEPVFPSLSEKCPTVGRDNIIEL